MSHSYKLINELRGLIQYRSERQSQRYSTYTRVRTEVIHIDLTSEGRSCKQMGFSPINKNTQAEEGQKFKPHSIEMNNSKVAGARNCKYIGRRQVGRK